MFHLSRSGMCNLRVPLLFFVIHLKILGQYGIHGWLRHFIRFFLPSNSVQMAGMISGLSLMYFSPLTLILTLYKAISINLPNTGTSNFVQANCGKTVKPEGKIKILSTTKYVATFYSLIFALWKLYVILLTLWTSGRCQVSSSVGASSECPTEWELSLTGSPFHMLLLLCLYEYKKGSFPLCTPEDLKGSKSRISVYSHFQLTEEWELQVWLFIES